MRTRMTLRGGRELASALRELPQAVRRPVLLRVLKKVGQPIADDAAERVHVWTGRLEENVVVLAVPAAKSTAEAAVVIGPTTEAFEGVFQEFGTVQHEAVPALRPAWDAGVEPALAGIASALRTEIERTAARVARKGGQ